MKTRSFIVIAPLLPLFLVIILAIVGITFGFWVYMILGIVCPLVAGILWFMYREMEKKIANLDREK